MTLEFEMKAGPEVGPNADALTALTRGRGPRRGNLEDLLKYWRPIMKKPGGFRRCVATLIDKPQFGGKPQRICAWLHHELTGKWPNEGNHHGRGGKKRRKRKVKSVVRSAVSSNMKSLNNTSYLTGVSSLRDTIRVSRDVGGILVQPIDGRQGAVDFKAAMFMQHSQDFRDFEIKKVGLFAAGSRTGEIIQGVGTALLPGDLSDFRSPVRSQIYETLTPGFSGPRIPGTSRLLRRTGRGARNKYRCPPGYENGGTFTDSEFSTCGAQILAIPSVGPGSPTADALRSLARLAGTAGLVQEIGDLRNNDGAIDIIRAAQIPAAPKKGSPTRAQTSIDLVLDRYQTEDFPTKVVRRDGVILDPVVPMSTIGGMSEFDDMADGSLIEKYVAGQIGIETVPTFSAGLRNVFVSIPDSGVVKISRVGGEITDEERAKLASSFVSRDPDMPDPSQLLRAWSGSTDGRFTVEFGTVTDGRFNVDSGANDLVRVQTKGGKQLTVPRWVYETFLSRGAPRRAKDENIYEIVEEMGASEEAGKKVVSPFMLSYKRNSFVVNSEILEYNFDIALKVSSFVSMIEVKKPTARRLGNTIGSAGRAVGGRSTALFDPGINRYRCPPGTRYGGRITDQFGRNCGYSLPTDIVDNLVSLRSKLDNLLRSRPGPRRGSRAIMHREVNPAVQRAARRLDSAMDSLDEVFKKTEGRTDGSTPGQLGATIGEARSNVDLTARDNELLKGVEFEAALGQLRDSLDGLVPINDPDPIRSLYERIERAASVEAGRLTDRPARTPEEKNRRDAINSMFGDILGSFERVAGFGEGRPRRPQGGTGRPRVPSEERRPRQPRSDSSPSDGIPDLNRFTVSGGPPYNYPGLPQGNYTRNRDGSVTNLDTGQVFDMVDTGAPETYGGNPRFLWTAREGDVEAPSVNVPSAERSDNLLPTPNSEDAYIVTDANASRYGGLPAGTYYMQSDGSLVRSPSGEVYDLDLNPNVTPGWRQRPARGSEESYDVDLNRISGSDRDVDGLGVSGRINRDEGISYAAALSAEEAGALDARLQELFDRASRFEDRGKGGVPFTDTLTDTELDRYIETLDAAAAVYADDPMMDDIFALRQMLVNDRDRRSNLRAAVGENRRRAINNQDDALNALDDLAVRIEADESTSTEDFIVSLSDSDISHYIKAIEMSFDAFDPADQAPLRELSSRLYAERARRRRRDGKRIMDVSDIDAVLEEFERRNRLYSANMGNRNDDFVRDIPDDDLLKLRNAFIQTENHPNIQNWGGLSTADFNELRGRVDAEFDRRFNGPDKRQVEHVDGRYPDERFDLNTDRGIDEALNDFAKRVQVHLNDKDGEVTQDFLRSLNDRDLAFYEGVLIEALGSDRVSLIDIEQRVVFQEMADRLASERIRRGDGFNPGPRTPGSLDMVSATGRDIPRTINDPGFRDSNRMPLALVDEIDDMPDEDIDRVFGALANEYADLHEYFRNELGVDNFDMDTIRRHIIQLRVDGERDPDEIRLIAARLMDFREINEALNQGARSDNRSYRRTLLQQHVGRMSPSRRESVLGLSNHPDAGVDAVPSDPAQKVDQALIDEAVNLHVNAGWGDPFVQLETSKLEAYWAALDAVDPEERNANQLGALFDIQRQLVSRISRGRAPDEVAADVENMSDGDIADLSDVQIAAHLMILNNPDIAGLRVARNRLVTEQDRRANGLIRGEELRDSLRELFDGRAGNPDTTTFMDVVRHLDRVEMEDWPYVKESIRKEIMDRYNNGDWPYNTPPQVFASLINAAATRRFSEQIMQLNIDVPDRSDDAIRSEIARIDDLVAETTDEATKVKLNDLRRVLQLEMARRNLGPSARAENVRNINDADMYSMDADGISNNLTPTTLANSSSSVLANSLENINSNPNLSDADKDYFGNIISEEIARRRDYGSFDLDTPLGQRSDDAVRAYEAYLLKRVDELQGRESLNLRNSANFIGQEINRRLAARVVSDKVDDTPDLDSSVRDAVEYDWVSAWEGRLEKRRNEIRNLIDNRYGDETPWNDVGGIDGLNKKSDAEIDYIARQMYSDGVEIDVGTVELDGVTYRKIIKPEVTSVNIERRASRFDNAGEAIREIEVLGRNQFILRPEGVDDDSQDISVVGSVGSHSNGGFRRSLHFQYDGDQGPRGYAYHANLGMKKSVPFQLADGRVVQVELSGGGGAAKFNDNATVWYSGLGLGKYKVSTAMDGPSVWARQGYRTDSESQLKGINDDMLTLLDNYNEYKAARAAGRRTTVEQRAAKAIIKDDERAQRLDTMLEARRRDADVDELPGHHDFMVALDGPDGKRNSMAFIAFKGDNLTLQVGDGVGQISQSEIDELVSEDPNILDNIVRARPVTFPFYNGEYNVNELLPPGWNSRESEVSASGGSAPGNSINEVAGIANRWTLNPNRQQLAPGDNRNGVLDPVPEGANGISSVEDATKALGEGRDIMDIPDNFVSQAIFFNSDHPNNPNPPANPRYRFFGSPEDGINNRNNRNAIIPSGMTLFQDNTTGQYLGFKGYGGASYGQNEAAVEAVGRMLQERLGIPAGQIRWDGPFGAAAYPGQGVGQNQGETRGIVFELAHNFVPPEALDPNNPFRLASAQSFMDNVNNATGRWGNDPLVNGFRPPRLDRNAGRGDVVDGFEYNGEFIKGLDPENVAAVVIHDVLTGNPDRHSGNYGLYVDPKTNQIKLIPWDHGLGIQGVGGSVANRNRQDPNGEGGLRRHVNRYRHMPIPQLLDQMYRGDRERVMNAINAVIDRMVASEDFNELRNDVSAMEASADMPLDSGFWLQGMRGFNERYQTLLDLARAGDYEAIQRILGFV